MITIKQYPPEIEITTMGSDSGSCLLLEPSQRQLLAWFAREKPEMVREALGVDKVIKELEKETTKAFKEITHEFLDQDTYRSGIIHGCTKAIALLKGEVGK
jgi:hypothetical protein